MKLLPAFSLAAIALSLASCGGKEGDNASAPSGEPVAAVPAPAGTTWADTISTNADGGFIMGNPNAAIKVTEFASYTCSHCKDFATESAEPMKELVNSGKVSYELRSYVRDPMDMAMALLVRCSGKEAFFPLSDQFFGNQAAMFEKIQALGDQQYQAIMSQPPETRFISLSNAAGFIDFVKQRGISEDQAKQCLANQDEVKKLAKGVEDATAKYNITGTPTLLINGRVIENTTTWDVMRGKIKEAGA
ncbi:thioredoxin domain-containing protein [Sphingobium phenoxybenzoativorans]|uniref:Thioredoxin domain-containing protein n=1 Tax=Sphingobium phenoxybenzoativorans TaxID=1592790 RepID=A0A975Q1X3_9SPHN|nr:thioredoxin domain-containing protein [Sphingobium phenoxybenzoativorans]QUT06400.1 thioredoxin domain-containing protein [Sphingobium phenoxybenzoativorans]